MVESESSTMVATITPTMKEKKKRKRKKRPLHKSKMITGYIIYASEIRKDVIKKYPDRDFGDISKLVGIEWKNLPQETKVAYEKRAQEQNAKSKAIAAEALELKKLADAAVERANEQHNNLSVSQTLPTTGLCNGYLSNGHNSNESMCNSSLMAQESDVMATSNLIGGTPTQPHMFNINAQQQPLHNIQQQTATNVQYCNINDGQHLQQTSLTPQGATTSQQQQSTFYTPINTQKNNIVYRKPSTVKLRPKDSSTQTDSIEWIETTPRKPLRFSDKFMDYLCKRSQNEKQLDCNGDVMSNET